ncbi:protein LYRIC-like isoform X1 [Leucoraja erinacea]|uniref:protein LYRIC-like isoform X1 n=1 Tax=Leucoraja erinaceus TaxID=7782 RepID=UPI00245646B1|nr:protein LYRIC-like isoform X1 [Leucoraja erinacea]
MLESLARWLQVLRGRELLFGGGLSDPALVALPAVALSLLVGVVLLVVVVIVQGRGHAAVSRALPIDEHLLLEASAASWKKPRQHEEPKKKRRKEKAKEPVNGHPLFSNGIQLLAMVETKGSQAPEKKAFKAKKKKQRLDEKTNDQNVTGRREKNEEEAGDWVTKISNREKRQQRKERQKKKCDVNDFVDANISLYSGGSRAASRTVKDHRGSDDQGETIAWSAPPDSPGDTADSWNEATEKAIVWHCAGGGDVGTVGWGSSDTPVSTSGWGAPPKDLSNSGADWEIADSVEKDIFSNIGTWDNTAGVKSPPVIFGAFPDPPETITHDNISSQDSPARCHLSTSLSSPVIDEAWLGLDDPFAVDLNSDWSPPTEEWGNWTGDKILIAQEAEKEKLKVSEEEEEKSQVNPAGSGRSKRKKRKEKGKHVEDSVESEVVTLEKPSSKSHKEPKKTLPVTADSSEAETNKLLDGSQNKFLADVDPKEMSQRSGIEMQQCLTEIAPSNRGASTSSNKKNDCAKTEKRKMKARRET